MTTITAAQYNELVRTGRLPGESRRSPVLSHQGRIVVELPLPGKGCEQNSRAHWAVKQRDVQALRQSACKAILEARLLGGYWKPWQKRVIAEVTFYVPNRRKDPSNLLAACKAIWDGVQDAGLVRNDRIIHARLSDEAEVVDPDRPRVVVSLWPTEQEDAQ